jgi:hypothetical protein
MESTLENNPGSAYETPSVLETFNAFEIMGAAGGFEVYSIGGGSGYAAINIAR